MQSLLLCVCLSLLSGVLTGLPLALNQLAPLAYIALIPYFLVLFRCFGRKKAKGALLCSFVFGFSYNLTAFGWISQMHPLYFTGMSTAASFALCYGGTLLLSVLFSLGFILYGFLMRLSCGTETVMKHRYLAVPLAASLWALLEASQEIGTFAVPWARLAVGQASYRLLIGSAGSFGCLFVGAVVVAVNASLAVALSEKQTAKRAVSAAAAVCIVALNIGISALSSPAGTDGTLEIAIIQGNIPTNEKWEDPAISADTYIAMLESLDGDAPDVVLLPETAVTFDITDSPPRLRRILAFAYKNHCTVLFGTYMFDENGNCFNTVREADETGLTDNCYAKQRLVPFGEYLPFYDFFLKNLPAVTQLELFSASLSSGDSVGIFDRGGVGIGTLICFDSLFPSLSRKAVSEGANVMFIATNDGWFSDTYAVNIHNSAAKVRAVETGRYYIRAANTGISSVISPTGESIELLSVNERGIIRCGVPAVSDVTLYDRIGNAFTWVCLAYAVSFFAYITAKQIKIGKKEK